MEPTKNLKPYLTPITILVAGILIASALYFRSPTVPAGDPLKQQAEALAKLTDIKPGENLRGELKAPVKIIEFSDLECPFCKIFHQSMLDLMAKYGESGQVAWVYRHFPLDKGAQPLHPKAGPEAIAAQCVAKLGGNDKFWQYIDQIFAVTPSNNGLDLALLSKLASDLKIDPAAFN